MAEPEVGTFEVARYARELAEPTRTIATRILLENEHVRVWELALAPGERAPFHAHTNTYFFACVDGGRARSRFPNGTVITMDYPVGFAFFAEPTDTAPEIHDLENVGDTPLRFTTVELLAAAPQAP